MPVRKGLVDDIKVHLTVYIPIDGRYTLDPWMTWHTKVGSYIAPQPIKLDVMVLCSGTEGVSSGSGSSVGSVGTLFLPKEFCHHL